MWAGRLSAVGRRLGALDLLFVAAVATSSAGLAGPVSFTPLGDLPGGSFYSFSYGVSADGLVVVGISSIGPSDYEAFRWTSGGGMVGLGDLPGGAFISSASGVSADGSVVVGYSKSALGDEAFLWTADGGMVSVRDLLIAAGVTGLDDWRLLKATGVSADGLTIVGWGVNPDGFYEAWIVVIPESPSAMLAAWGAAAVLLACASRRRARPPGQDCP